MADPSGCVVSPFPPSANADVSGPSREALPSKAVAVKSYIDSLSSDDSRDSQVSQEVQKNRHILESLHAIIKECKDLPDELIQDAICQAAFHLSTGIRDQMLDDESLGLADHKETFVQEQKQHKAVLSGFAKEAADTKAKSLKAAQDLQGKLTRKKSKWFGGNVKGLAQSTAKAWVAAYDCDSKPKYLAKAVQVAPDLDDRQRFQLLRAIGDRGVNYHGRVKSLLSGTSNFEKVRHAAGKALVCAVHTASVTDPYRLTEIEHVMTSCHLPFQKVKKLISAKRKVANYINQEKARAADFLRANNPKKAVVHLNTAREKLEALSKKMGGLKREMTEIDGWIRLIKDASQNEKALTDIATGIQESITNHNVSGDKLPAQAAEAVDLPVVDDMDDDGQTAGLQIGGDDDDSLSEALLPLSREDEQRLRELEQEVELDQGPAAQSSSEAVSLTTSLRDDFRRQRGSDLSLGAQNHRGVEPASTAPAGSTIHKPNQNAGLIC